MTIYPLRFFISFFAAVLITNAARADTPIFLFAGQSNMGGYASDTRQLGPEYLAEQPNVDFYGDTDTWQTINLGARPSQPINIASGSGFGPEAIVGNDLVKAGLFPKVLEIKYLLNGSPSDSFLASPEDAAKNNAPNPVTTSWAPDFTPAEGQKSIYQIMLERVKHAREIYTEKTGEKTYIAGFFFMQGESDAFSSAEVAKLYGQNLKRLILALRRDYNAPDMPFVFGRIAAKGNFTHVPLVREGQDNVVKPGGEFFVPHTFEVDTDAYPLAEDSRHYTNAGVISLGHDMAKGYQAITAKK